MASSVRAVPEGYHTLTPYLICRNATEALAFYAKALGAKELFRMGEPDGRVGHAEMQIGDSRFMLADEFPERGIRGPASLGGAGVTLMVYVENVDALVAQAVGAGGTLDRPIKNEFYGDRMGTIKDPFGHIWHIATHQEDVPPDEMERRSREAQKG